MSDRDTNEVSNRNLLAKAPETVAQNDIEWRKLFEYKVLLRLIEWEEAKLHKLKEQFYELRSKNDKTSDETKKMLDYEIKQSISTINTYDRQLLALEATKPLKDIIERERTLAYERAKQAFDRHREEQQKKTEEFIAKYHEQRAIVIANRRAAIAKANQEAEKQKRELEKERKKAKIRELIRKIQNLAIPVSLVLCLILYFSFLTFAFTEKNYIDTYICYTTKTGECYHAAYCGYLYRSSYETTVYEAKKKNYRSCSRCNPCQDRYETSIIVKKRNYIAPALISIPISVATYFVLIKTNKEDSG